METNVAHQAGDIILDRSGSAAIIRLNRPRALNSVTLSMVHGIRDALVSYIDTPDVGCVILTGAGERGLCAGGDVRAIYESGRAGDSAVTQFWRDEFPLNHLISRYPKPFIALMDGITMGGGVGLSAHAAHRIVTERTRLAMPETGIGYFPDVGATWLLPKAPGETGTWLGLTGNEIGAADSIYAKLADVCVPSRRLDQLVENLGALAPGAGDAAIRQTIDRVSVSASGSILADHSSLIDRVFAFDDVSLILSALESDTSDFAQATMDVLRKRSPTSLKLTLRMLRLGRTSSGLMECLEREFAAGSEILKGHDFYEGVRAAIIDKDRNPIWAPATLTSVSDQDIDRHLVVGHAPLFPNHRL